MSKYTRVGKGVAFKNKEGEEKSSLRVLNVFPWNDGTRKKSVGEKVPF